MDLRKSSSEPLLSFVMFHDQFNRNIKLASASLAFIERLSGLPAADKPLATLILKSDVEPWGNTPWRSIAASVPEAKSFVASLGIVRATSAFEDYVTRCWAELDRADDRRGSRTTAANGQSLAPTLTNLMARLNTQIDSQLLLVADLFVTARNCIVHRSNRASDSLEGAGTSTELVDALKAWSTRPGKWTISLPTIREGETTEWLPRHSIMASDCFYRLAKAVDTAVVHRLGVDGMVHMAAHWCFFAEAKVPTAAKLNTETVLRSQLINRYGVRKVVLSQMIGVLRESGRWNDARAAFDRMRGQQSTAQA